jgi:hypothetical protein
VGSFRLFELGGGQKKSLGATALDYFHSMKTSRKALPLEMLNRVIIGIGDIV